MSALITTTSQAVELLVHNNGTILSTSYPNSVESAIKQAELLGVTSIDFEELDFWPKT